MERNFQAGILGMVRSEFREFGEFLHGKEHLGQNFGNSLEFGELLHGKEFSGWEFWEFFRGFLGMSLTGTGEARQDQRRHHLIHCHCGVAIPAGKTRKVGNFPGKAEEFGEFLGKGSDLLGMSMVPDTDFSGIPEFGTDGIWSGSCSLQNSGNTGISSSGDFTRTWKEIWDHLEFAEPTKIQNFAGLELKFPRNS